MSKWEQYKKKRAYKKRANALAAQILSGGAVIANMDVKIPIEITRSAMNLTLFSIDGTHDNKVTLKIEGKTKL